MVERLQVKASSIGRILTNLERQYHNADKEQSDLKKSTSGQSLGYSSKRPVNKIQKIPPFNASKVKSSPTTEPAVPAAEVAQIKDELKELAEEIDD